MPDLPSYAHDSADSFSLEGRRVAGTVLSFPANYYRVQLDHPYDLLTDEGVIAVTSLLCTRRSRLKKVGQRVMVGDRVSIDEPDWQGQRGAIAQVLPRSTELDRPPIANATQLVLVFALAEPELEPLQLSRFLVKAETTDLAVTLCLSKGDLVSPEVKTQWCDRLNAWGYEPIVFSTYAHENLGAIAQVFQHQVSVISGPSGVGKSSLINDLIPNAGLRVGEVSGKLGKGRHTTRHVELFELTGSGLLADTPGFNQPDLTCYPAELASFFPEARQRLAQNSCQFSNCLHRDEPNCAVRGDWERYDHYLLFLEEAIAHQDATERQGEAESTLKAKTGEAGQVQYEPKLESKKYRRQSRKTQRQALQDLDIDRLMQDADLEDEQN
jgi:ribosome biogenesis GTPase / thiamine phosphate phosphatase